MTSTPNAHRAARAALLGLLVTLGLLVAAGPATAQAAGPAGAAFWATAPDIPGIDVNAIAKDLSDDGVAVVGTSVSAADLQAVVKDAAAKDVDLGVVSTNVTMDDVQGDALAQELATRTGKTILVISPRVISSFSKTISGADEEKARDAASKANGDVEAARVYVDTLTKKSSVSIWLILGIVAVVVVAGLIWASRRSKKAAKPAPPPDPVARTKQLSDSLAGWSDEVLSISDRVDLTDRPDLKQRFGELSGLYSALQARLSSTLQSEAEAQQISAQIDILGAQLNELQADVNAALPGMQPPRPAG